MAWTGSPINVEREVLIGFDLLLAVVVGLVLYAASARDPQAPPDFFDGLQLLLVVSALVVDAVALAAIAQRISEFGFTPNRVAALGENLILLVNLAWTAWLYARFLRGEDRSPTSSDGRSRICRCTPSGRHWWLSCSRRCSAIVDAQTAHPSLLRLAVYPHITDNQDREVFGATRGNSENIWRR